MCTTAIKRTFCLHQAGVPSLNRGSEGYII